MTHEQKAHELIITFEALEVSIFYSDKRKDDSIATNNMLTLSACQCAIACVKEIKKAIDFDHLKITPEQKIRPEDKTEHAYWDEVIECIKKIR